MNDRWSTPQEVFEPLDNEFGFDLDVCAEWWNTKCLQYLDPDLDGLSQKWTGTCWMNPPYGREIGKWIQKAYEESLTGTTVVCLVPTRTETAWWHDYCLKGEIRFVRGRIHFTDANGKMGHPRFGSAIVVFRGIEGGFIMTYRELAKKTGIKVSALKRYGRHLLIEVPYFGLQRGISRNLSNNEAWILYVAFILYKAGRRNIKQLIEEMPKTGIWKIENVFQIVILSINVDLLREKFEKLLNT